MSDVRRIHGLLSYFRKFVKDFSKKAKPLTEQMKKDDKYEVQWTGVERAAIKDLVSEIEQ